MENQVKLPSQPVLDEIKRIRDTFEDHAAAERAARKVMTEAVKRFHEDRDKISSTEQLANGSVFWSTGAFVIACLSLLLHTC